MEQVSISAAHVGLNRYGVSGDRRDATDRCEPQVNTGTWFNGQPSTTTLDPHKRNHRDAQRRWVKAQMSVGERLQGLSVSMVRPHGREVRGQELVGPAGL